MEARSLACESGLCRRVADTQQRTLPAYLSLVPTQMVQFYHLLASRRPPLMSPAIRRQAPAPGRPPRRRPPAKRRRLPQQPGIRNASSANCPARYACSTSSTDPQICGITCTPAAVNIASNGHETAPQIKNSTPSPLIHLVLTAISGSSILASARRDSTPSSISTTMSRLATSSTGDTRPFQIGIPTLITVTACRRRANPPAGQTIRLNICIDKDLCLRRPLPPNTQ